jgi:hypothetical protein
MNRKGRKKKLTAKRGSEPFGSFIERYSCFPPLDAGFVIPSVRKGFARKEERRTACAWLPHPTGSIRAIFQRQQVKEPALIF